MGVEKEIRDLKAQRNALILAHNYVDGDIQDIADFCGDSLELARKAAEAHAEVIVCCGVRFMAETAKLLSPDAVVLLPNPDAGCPMADMADPQDVRKCRKENPDAILAAYVNTTAETKSEVDICCTSGNAEKIVNALPTDKKIVFIPDRNLGANVANQTGRKLELWHGCCPIHAAVTAEMIEKARIQHPDAPVLVHPECPPEAVAAADYALSTAGILKFVKTSSETRFIIGTETGIIHRLENENPDKEFFQLDPILECGDMKKITLENVRDALRDMKPEIKLPAAVMKKAILPIRKMLEK